MYKIIIIVIFLFLSLSADQVDGNVTLTPKSVDVVTKKGLKKIDSQTEVEVPLYYGDYKWDLGLIAGITDDGRHIDARRQSVGFGLHAAYHITPGFTVHGEYTNLFKTYADIELNRKIKQQFGAISFAYDFTPEYLFSIYAKAGLGYESLTIYKVTQKHPTGLLGFGLRFKLANRVNAFMEGRLRMRLTDMSEPDTGLVGTVGIDYHFGLSDQKKELINLANEHNKRVTAEIERRKNAKKVLSE